ncbi:MAG: hypothetical protein ACYCXR_09435 [Coriobacteriia bacterium]
MLKRFAAGAALIAKAIRAFVAFPQLIVPLLATWLIYAPTLVYSRYFIEWDAYSLGVQLAIVFGLILILSFVISSACLVLLELIEQIESGRPVDLGDAARSAIPNVGRAFPIMLLWTVLWFLITVVEMFLPRRDDSEDSDPSAQNVAETVAGFGRFSLSHAFLEALSKGVRMLAFLIYPAIAWESMSARDALKKGLGVARAHKAEFAGGFVMTEVAATIVFLPPTAVFILSDNFNVVFPEPVWFVVIVYCAFAWSFSVMLEQMFTAQLYLWHTQWEDACTAAAASGGEPPTLRDVKQPSLVDGISAMKPAAQSEPPG